ncbi:MAG: YbaB/EbfC family nucleoid-associated protein [Lachnospiraceae bacterium]
MAKRGGYGAMPGNMNNLMKQAQRMQRQMEEKQAELANKEWEATVGGGAVKVKVSGEKQVTSVTIAPEVVDPDDIEMLQDLIMAAVNEAWKNMEEEQQAVMGQLTGGLSGFPF